MKSAVRMGGGDETESDNAVILIWSYCTAKWKDEEKGRGHAGRQKRRYEVMEMKGAEPFWEEGASTQRCRVDVWGLWQIVLPCYLVSPVLHCSFVGALLPDTTGKIIPLQQETQTSPFRCSLLFFKFFFFCKVPFVPCRCCGMRLCSRALCHISRTTKAASAENSFHVCPLTEEVSGISRKA